MFSLSSLSIDSKDKTMKQLDSDKAILKKIVCLELPHEDF